MHPHEEADVNPTTTARPRRVRRPLLAAGGASLLLASGGMAWLQHSAGADPVSTDVAATCAIAGTSAAMTVPMTVDDVVDPIAPGAQQTLKVDQGLGQLPVEVTVNSVVVTTPIPAEVASTDSVTFEGGNMTGSYQVVDGNLVVTFTGPQSSSQLQFPRTIVNQTVGDAPGGDTIHWKVWSSLVADTNYGQATCTPDDPSTDLNTTAISGGGPATTPTTTDDGTGTPGTTAPSTTVPTTPTTPTTTVPGTDGSSSPGVEVCVTVTSPVPVPVPVPPCTTVPPSTGGSSPLPVPVPAPGGGLPTLPVPLPPLPAPGDGGGLPLPLPAPGDGLPLPLPGGSGTPGVDVTIDAQVGVSI
jgi:hypothetical protein